MQSKVCLIDISTKAVVNSLGCTNYRIGWYYHHSTREHIMGSTNAIFSVLCTNIRLHPLLLKISSINDSFSSLSQMDQILRSNIPAPVVKDKNLWVVSWLVTLPIYLLNRTVPSRIYLTLTVRNHWMQGRNIH